MQIAITLIRDMRKATRIEWPWEEIGLNGFNFDKNLFADPQYEWRFQLGGALKCDCRDVAVAASAETPMTTKYLYFFSPPGSPK
jgi:hypothetical protein